MAQFITRYRLIIIIACFATGIALSLLIPLSETDPEIRNYVPARMKSRVDTDSIEKVFGVQDIVMILFSDTNIVSRSNLEQIRTIDRGLSRIGGISNRISPFTMRSIKGEDGMMIAEKLIPGLPDEKSEEEAIRKAVLENIFARDMVISSDMTSAAITATINTSAPETETLHKIDSILASTPGNAQIDKGGLPYIRRHILEDVRKDGIILVPLALIIMLVILRLTLSSWKLVMMPFSVVCLSTGASMGLVPLLGWKISIMTLLVPVILVAVANNYGIYLVARFQDIGHKYDPSDKNKMIASILASLNMPVLFSGLTTIAGILGLVTHSIIPARQVGILAAAGVSLALGMSLTLIPALICTVSQGRGYASKTGRMRPLDRIMSVLSELIIRNPGRILLFSAVFIASLSLGSLFLKTDTNQENYFPRKHPVRKASVIINSKFGGSQTISVMISGEVRDPAVLKGIDSLTRRIGDEDGVGNVYSISQVVREMSKAIYDKEEEGYDMIPGSVEAISQMFELYNMSGNPDDFSQLVNSENTRAHVLIRLSDPQNHTVKRVKDRIEEYCAGIPADVTIGGYALIMSDFAESIIRGQVASLLFALITVFILLSVIFRSLKGGLLGSIPLSSSIAVLFGFMGFSGLALDAATALLSSIMIGVGVDFTIQYIWCFSGFLKMGLSFPDATRSAMQRIGRSIFVNAASVMAGFSVLMLSGFTSIRFFGYLVILSIGSCLAGALILVPAIVLKYRPLFLNRIQNKSEN